MPIGVLNPQILSPEQANPFLYGLNKAAGIANILSQAKLTEQQAMMQKLNAEKMRQLMPFVEQNARAELEKAQLYNKYYGPNIESEMKLRNAQGDLTGQQGNLLRFKMEHPGLMGGGIASELEGLKLMGLNVDNNQSNYSSDNIGTAPFKTGNTLADALFKRRFAESDYKRLMAQGYNWNHLPTETRSQLIGQGYGMGVEPLKMMQYINQGLSLPQIAEKEGLDPNNLPPPIYPPTTATKTRIQQVQQVGNELDYLSSAATALISPYAATVAGISSEKLKDMFSNQPEDQKRLGRYIGALSIQTGIANGRALLEGGRPGLEVMRMIKNSSLQGIDQHAPFKMSKVAYEEAQKTIDQLLQKGSKIRAATGMNPFSEISKSKIGEGKKLKPVSEMTTEEIKAELAGGTI